MEKKTFEIWCEGFRATGQSGNAYMMGTGQGSDFDEAVRDYMEKHPDRDIRENTREGYFTDEDYENRRSNWNDWACNLFDNEADARKAFG